MDFDLVIHCGKIIDGAGNPCFHADIYPYTSGSSLLSMLIPDWVHEGGVDRMIARLKQAEVRKKIEYEYGKQIGIFQRPLLPL